MQLKIDQTSLPANMQQVIFQLFSETEEGIWREGYYKTSEGIFITVTTLEYSVFEVESWETTERFTKNFQY